MIVNNISKRGGVAKPGQTRRTQDLKKGRSRPSGVRGFESHLLHQIIGWISGSKKAIPLHRKENPKVWKYNMIWFNHYCWKTTLFCFCIFFGFSMTFIPLFSLAPARVAWQGQGLLIPHNGNFYTFHRTSSAKIFWWSTRCCN